MCKGFVLPSNCIDDRGLPAFCVFHGTKSVNNGVMCKGFWLLPSHCIDDLGCTAFCVFHGRAKAHDPQFQHQSLHSSWEAPAGEPTVLS